MRTLIVLEDSSRASLGGGQKVTLAVMAALTPYYSIHLFDHAASSRFLELARPLVSKITCLTDGGPHGRRTGGRLRASFGACRSLKSSIRAITRALDDEGVESPIVYATTTKTLVLAYLLSLFRRILYVFHAHLVFHAASPFRWALMPAFRRARLVLCPSRAVAKRISGRRLLLYNGVPLASRTPRRLGDQQIVVASFSGLIRLKGIRYFMESYPLLRAGDRVEYRIYGAGEEQEYLQRLENEHVRLMGFADNVDDVLRNVAVVVVPSLVPEALGMSFLEALSFGIPVIGTNMGGLRELLRDGEVGYQVPARDPAAIAAKIDYLIEHPDVYEQLSANALEYVKRFDIEHYRETVRGLFRDIPAWAKR